MSSSNSLTQAAKRERTSQRRRLPSVALISLAVFGITVGLTGGSSRADNVLLLALRPINVLCLMAILLAGGVEWRRIRAPFLLLGAFALTIAIQLVPLPPRLWQAIGFRAHYLDVLEALNATGLWQPLSVAPDGTWNSLIALLVPLTVLVGFAALTEPLRQALLGPMLGLVALSMVFGLGQMAGGTTSFLYLYEITTRSLMVGLFANRNHQAALLVVALPLLRAWTLLPAQHRQWSLIRGRIAIGSGMLTLSYLLVLGSRTGIALALLGVVGAYLVKPSFGPQVNHSRFRWLLPAGLALGSLAVITVATYAGRSIALDRLVGTDVERELRIAAMPTMFRILDDAMPFGTGYGSFASVFASYEPDELLKPTYFNNAHNDLLELAITGGVPALAVLVAFLLWWGRASYRSFLASTVSDASVTVRRAASFAILILLLAALTDYPLRTPLMAAVFATLCGWLAWPSDHSSKGANDNRGKTAGAQADVRIV